MPARTGLNGLKYTYLDRFLGHDPGHGPAHTSLVGRKTDVNFFGRKFPGLRLQPGGRLCLSARMQPARALVGDDFFVPCSQCDRLFFARQYHHVKRDTSDFVAVSSLCLQACLSLFLFFGTRCSSPPPQCLTSNNSENNQGIRLENGHVLDTTVQYMDVVDPYFQRRPPPPREHGAIRVFRQGMGLTLPRGSIKGPTGRLGRTKVSRQRHRRQPAGHHVRQGGDGRRPHGGHLEAALDADAQEGAAASLPRSKPRRTFLHLI